MYALPPARWQRSLATSGASLLSGAFAISFSVARVLAFERMLRNGDCADRKSTRLNSSHGYISYAVFCLKKKNNDRGTPTSSIPSSILGFRLDSSHNSSDVSPL